MTIFASQANARTFDYQVRSLLYSASALLIRTIIPFRNQAGDVGYVPSPMGELSRNW